MTTQEHIAIFAAHPDDEGAVWATLCKYQEFGHKISIIWSTCGEMFIAPIGKYVHYLPLLIKARFSKEFRTRLSARIKSIRKKEALKAAELIGAKPYFLEFRDIKVPDIVDVEAVRKITNLIRKVKPSIVLTHFFREGHIDHRHTSALVLKSVLFSRDKDIETEYPPHKVRIFGFWNERGRGFKANFHVNVGNQIKRMENWENCYVSQGFRIVGRFAKLLARWNSRKTPYSYTENYRIYGERNFKIFGEFFP